MQLQVEQNPEKESLSHLNRDSKMLRVDSASFTNSSLHQKENKYTINFICWTVFDLSSKTLVGKLNS